MTLAINNVSPPSSTLRVSPREAAPITDPPEGYQDPMLAEEGVADSFEGSPAGELAPSEAPPEEDALETPPEKQGFGAKAKGFFTSVPGIITAAVGSIVLGVMGYRFFKKPPAEPIQQGLSALEQATKDKEIQLAKQADAAKEALVHKAKDTAALTKTEVKDKAAAKLEKRRFKWGFEIKPSDNLATQGLKLTASVFAAPITLARRPIVFLWNLVKSNP